MYYEPSSYGLKCRIDSVTSLKNTLEIIETNLNEQQLKWFKDHPQFQHFFHMTRQSHKYTAMWALILRTGYISDDEWWIIPNGVPLRYSIREHALYTGLCCDPLPRNFEQVFEKEHNLSLDFAGSFWNRKKNKGKSHIDVFYLMIVDNLSLCEKFPWGTLSFNECMDSLSAMLKKAKKDRILGSRITSNKIGKEINKIL
ncbi:hypothetical protein N665_3205s0001 [Sinapis alba]|nr:hypothetical protein N665_3205s0001 [Sinapis alba]